jgi:hypothetical protein
MDRSIRYILLDWDEENGHKKEIRNKEQQKPTHLYRLDHLTLERSLRRSLHFFSFEFSGCFLGEDILDDGIVGCLEGDVLNNRLSLDSKENLRDMMVRDGSINKIYIIRLG